MPKWILVKDRLPDDGCNHLLKYTYANGNTGNAAGYLEEDNTWKIDWSDDFPLSEDISHWLEE